MPRHDTPTSWLVSRLLQSDALRELLGTPTGERLPVFNKSDVPDESEQPPVFIAVRPPASLSLRVYAELFPQALDGQYLIWAETRTDRLPADKGFDDVLGPICAAIFEALTGGSPDAPTGGKVWSCHVTGFYTPDALNLTQHIKIQQVGIVATLIAT